MAVLEDLVDLSIVSSVTRIPCNVHAEHSTMLQEPAGGPAFERARPRPSSSRLRVSTPTIVLLPLSTFLQAAAPLASSLCKPERRSLKRVWNAQQVTLLEALLTQ